MVPEFEMVPINTTVIPEDIDSVLPLAIIILSTVHVPEFHEPTS
jgi:hypothetical protein